MMERGAVDVVRYWNETPRFVSLDDGGAIDPHDAFSFSSSFGGQWNETPAFPMPWHVYREPLKFDVECEIVVSDWDTMNCTNIRAHVRGETEQTIDLAPETTWCHDSPKPTVLRFAIPSEIIHKGQWAWYLSLHVTDNPGYFVSPRVYSFESVTIRYVYKD